MEMDEKDNAYNRFFREKFEHFSPDPPTEIWSTMHDALSRHQGEKPDLVPWFYTWIRLKHVLYPVMVLLVGGLISLIIWQSNSSAHIHGTAFVNGNSLVHGTAYLFHVQDHQRPLDSVTLHSTVSLDSSGSYHFRNIQQGKYMVRIQVDPGSPWFPDYRFGYYGDKTSWDQSVLINTSDSAGAYNIHLHRWCD